MRKALMLLCKGGEIPPRTLRVLAVRRARSSNRGDPLPARVRSRERARASAGVDQALQGCQRSWTRSPRIATPLRRWDGVPRAASRANAGLSAFLVSRPALSSAAQPPADPLGILGCDPGFPHFATVR